MRGDCTEFMVQGIEIVYDRRHIGGCRIGARFHCLGRSGSGSSHSIVACKFPDIDAQVTLMYTKSVMPEQNLNDLIEELRGMVTSLWNQHIVLTGQFQIGGAHFDHAWIDISAECHGYQVMQGIADMIAKKTWHIFGMTLMHPKFALVLRSPMDRTPTGDQPAVAAPTWATHHGADYNTR